MAIDRPNRQKLPGWQVAPGRFAVAFAPVLAAILYLPAGHLRAQWAVEPPIDPFARTARGPGSVAPASAYEPVVSPPPAPAINGPPGQTLQQGTYWQGPASGPALAGPPPGMYSPGPSPNVPPFGPPAVPVPYSPFQDGPQMQGTVPSAGPPPENGPPENQSLVPSGTNLGYRLLDHLEGNVVVRGYYGNDQRIEWSGMETTFGAEAVLTPRLRQRCGDFEFIVDSELNINQPFDQNQLLNTQERRSYAANFQVNEFDISQLALVTNYQDWTFKAGKFVTPFGRTYFPLYTNSYWDAPFIRTEVIDWRETGILAHYKSGYFVADAAFTNGSENRDTNSGKAVVARVGLEDSDQWAIGMSAKRSGGNGSEEQKEFDTYYGVDMMVRSGPFQLSAECVYDDYGFGRPGLDPDNITWVRSIYYRDVSSGQQGVPCTGIGYYVNLGYADGPWNALVNYGDFYPLYIGTAPNQRVQHRGLIKAAYQFAKPLQVYSALIVENGGYIAQCNQARIPVAVLEGFQFTF